jgi:hypothetical protein
MNLKNSHLIDGVLEEGDPISNNRLLFSHPYNNDYCIVLDGDSAYVIPKDNGGDNFTTYDFDPTTSLLCKIVGDNIKVATLPLMDGDVVVDTSPSYVGRALHIENECGGCGRPLSIYAANVDEFDELSKTHHVYDGLQNHTLEEAGLEADEVDLVIVTRSSRCMDCKEY